MFKKLKKLISCIFVFLAYHLSFSTQRAKKVVSGNPGLVDFAMGLVNSVFNLPDRKVMSFEEFD